MDEHNKHFLFTIAAVAFFIICYVGLVYVSFLLVTQKTTLQEVEKNETVYKIKECQNELHIQNISYFCELSNGVNKTYTWENFTHTASKPTKLITAYGCYGGGGSTTIHQDGVIIIKFGGDQDTESDYTSGVSFQNNSIIDWRCVRVRDIR